jgi:hypothetical protein
MTRSFLIVLMLGSLTACADRGPAVREADVVGTWVAQLPVAADSGRALALTFQSGNAAELRIESAGAPSRNEAGTWTVRADGSVHVLLARDPLGPATTELTFRLAGGKLSAVGLDSTRWGSAGLTLARQASPK